MNQIDREPGAQFTVDHAAGIVRVWLRGDVTFAQLCVVEDELLSSSEYNPSMPVVIDVRGATSIPTPEQIRKLALDRLLRRTIMPIGKLAIVANTPTSLAFAETVQTFASDERHDVRTFANEHDAEAWVLGIDSAVHS